MKEPAWRRKGLPKLGKELHGRKTVSTRVRIPRERQLRQDIWVEKIKLRALRRGQSTPYYTSSWWARQMFALGIRHSVLGGAVWHMKNGASVVEVMERYPLRASTVRSLARNHFLIVGPVTAQELDLDRTVTQRFPKPD